MNETQAMELGRAIREVRPQQLGGLGLVAPMLEALEIEAVTNAVVVSKAGVSPGQIVVLLTLNWLLSPQLL